MSIMLGYKARFGAPICSSTRSGAMRGVCGMMTGLCTLHGKGDEAARKLGEIGSPAVQSLIRALSDPDEWVRGAAAWALGEIKDKRAVEPLRKLLNDPSSAVRQAAREAMGKIEGG